MGGTLTAMESIINTGFHLLLDGANVENLIFDVEIIISLAIVVQA